MNIPKRNSPTVPNKLEYVYAQNDKEDHTCIKLTCEKFKDVIYKYGKVGFAGIEIKKGEMPLKFDYTIMRNPNDFDLLDNQEFIDYIGDVLVEIMDKQMKEGTVVYE